MNLEVLICELPLRERSTLYTKGSLAHASRHPTCSPFHSYLSTSREISTSVSPITIPSPKDGSVYFASCCLPTAVLCSGALPVISIYFITFSLVIALGMWNLWRTEVGCWETQWLKKSHPHFPQAVLGYFYQLSTTRTLGAHGIPTAQLAPCFMSPASGVIHLLFPRTKARSKHTAYYIQVLFLIK